MKRLQIIVFFIILLAVVSCCPTRQLTTSTQDSVRVETVVRYERVLDTVFIEIPVEVVRQTVRDTTSHLETSYAVSDARITTDGALFHSLENKPQKKPIPTEKEVIYRDSIFYRDKIVKKSVPVERELTWWQQTQMKGFWIVLAILVVACRKKIFAVVRRFI